MWNILNLVLSLVLLMFCLPTVKNEDCQNFEIIVGQHGKEQRLIFPFSDLRDEYNEIYTTVRDGRNIMLNEIQIQDLKKESYIKFKTKTGSLREDIIYINGNPTGLAGNLTEIFMTNDAFVVKKTKLQQVDAGIYWIDYKLIKLGQKILIIAGKPIIKRQSPNPVLKPEDNYTSTIQLECHSVSTSIGDCPLSMYTVWYKNGMRMTDVDPILSQINVTVDQNGGSFTCLATDYLPCYQRLQSTKHYDVLNIDKCVKNVLESEAFKVQPEFAPIDVKLEPDQREITVYKNEDLKVSCSAKCHPECGVKWEKDDQILDSSNLIYLSETVFGNDLNIVNINSSYEGVYVCLVKNIHGEIKKNFTLSVGETEDNEQNDDVNVYLPVIIIVFLIVVVVLVIMIIEYKRYKRRKSHKKEKKKMLEFIEKIELIRIEEWTKMLEFIEERGLKKMEERKKKMLESIEEDELIKKMQEEKIEMLEFLKEDESIRIEEEKIEMLEFLKEDESIRIEEWKRKMLEFIEEDELKKMQRREDRDVGEYRGGRTIDDGRGEENVVEFRVQHLCHVKL